LGKSGFENYQGVPSCRPISIAPPPLGIKLPLVGTATTKDDKISMNFIVELNFNKIVDRYNISLIEEVGVDPIHC
jgi:hypothetical protein